MGSCFSAGCPAEIQIYMVMGPIDQLQTPCSDPSIIYNPPKYVSLFADETTKRAQVGMNEKRDVSWMVWSVHDHHTILHLYRLNPLSWMSQLSKFSISLFNFRHWTSSAP